MLVWEMMTTAKMLHPKKKKEEETILEKHVDAHSHSETKRMTQ